VQNRSDICIAACGVDVVEILKSNLTRDSKFNSEKNNKARERRRKGERDIYSSLMRTTAEGGEREEEGGGHRSREKKEKKGERGKGRIVFCSAQYLCLQRVA
jgi:hypothetical protein